MQTTSFQGNLVSCTAILRIDIFHKLNEGFENPKLTIELNLQAFRFELSTVSWIEIVMMREQKE